MKSGMSRPAKPYASAGCESFMKTLKRAEIDANRFEDLGFAGFTSGWLPPLSPRAS
jgi:hypothetical protein